MRKPAGALSAHRDRRRFPVRPLEAARALCICVVLALSLARPAAADWVPARGAVDSRMRVAPYSADQVYRLYGYVGYQIDIEFDQGEVFKGLAAGDVDGISFEAHGRHLFLKPRVPHVRTNLTVLTNLRQYEFDYSASPGPPDPALGEVIYALRFTYPGTAATRGVALAAKRIASDLAKAPAIRPRNYDYWYCGRPELKPQAAWDDGVRTRIRFGARTELPAIFVRNADGSESLVNFSMYDGDVVIQRVVQRFVLRRGRLAGCIVNRHFTGGGERLDSNTVSPNVERVTKRPAASAGGGP
jgi:type IV secretion system protein VirB9